MMKWFIIFFLMKLNQTISGRNFRSNFKFKDEILSKDFKVRLQELYWRQWFYLKIKILLQQQTKIQNNDRKFCIRNKQQKRIRLQKLYLFKILKRNIARKKIYATFISESKYDDEDFAVKMDAMRRELNDSHVNLENINIKMNAFLVNELNLKWNNCNIDGTFDIREKIFSYIYNKVELLNSYLVKNLFGPNRRYNVNWNFTFKLLKNEISNDKFTTNAIDTHIRGFRFKNLLQILPGLSNII